MRITFVYPDFVVIRKHQRGNQFQVVQGGWYSEGLASLSAVLKSKGHKVSLIHLTQPIEREEFEKQLENEKADILSFMIRTSAFPYVQEYLKWAKKIDPSLITVLGGYHPTIAPKECINAEGVDIVCIGEGEGPLLDLCQALEQKKSIDDIPNLLIKKGDRIIKNSPRELIFPLDSLPLPDFELFDFSNLISSQTKVATAMISRGCPYSCAYCCNHKIREVYPDPQHYTRFRSPKNVIAYLKKLLSLRPQMFSIRFLDNIFGIEKNWIKEFSQLYKKEINLPFSCNHRPNLADFEILELLREAGCYQIYFGVETGNEELRRNILSRHMDNRQIIKAFNNCRQLGIRTLAYNIVGLPFETPSKTLETIKLNAQINPGSMVINIFTPYPYTKLYDICLKQKFIPSTLLGEKGGIDYRDEVFIDQPQFPKKEVLFLSLYFKFFVWLYRKNQKLWPSFDKIILWRYLPKRTFILLMKTWETINNHLKDFLRKKMPSLYIFLRDRIKKTNSLKGYRNRKKSKIR